MSFLSAISKPAFATATLLAGAVLCGQANQVTPFSAEQAAVAAQPAVSKKVPPTLEKLEFNGFMKIGDRVSLSFYDHVNKQNHWISLNESKGGFSVDQFDAKQKHVRVSFQGFSRYIYLSKEQIAELKEAAAARPALTDADRIPSVESKTVDTRDPETIEAENEAAAMLSFDMAVTHELQEQYREEQRERRRAERLRRAALNDRRAR